uniref:Putative secreted protein n=1 Tax=Anopheles darlingi TaxID=43151 RepID=A0A2M4DFE2_ANODA
MVAPLPFTFRPFPSKPVRYLLCSSGFLSKTTATWPPAQHVWCVTNAKDCRYSLPWNQGKQARYTQKVRLECAHYYAVTQLN